MTPSSRDLRVWLLIKKIHYLFKFQPSLQIGINMKTVCTKQSTSNYIAVVVFFLAALCPLLDSPVNGQVIDGNVAAHFTNANQIGTLGGVITQLAFDPNDDSSLYVATWMSGIWRFDYAEGGALSNGSQVIAPEVNLNRDGTHANGSYGIAFHDDPALGSVMYLSRALVNDTSFSPRTQGLGSIVRVNDANGDGTWGGTGDLNQTIADNIFVAQWTHQIDQFAVHGNTLYVSVGSLTNNGGVDFSGNTGIAAIGESAHTAAILFIADLTQVGLTDNAAYFNIGSDLSDPADVQAFKTDTNVFTSTDPAKLRVFSTGLRNPFGIAVTDEGDVYVSNNQGGATAGLEDQLYLSEFQDDHGFNKAGDAVGGDWKNPNNSNASALAAQNAGYFQNVPDPQQDALALLGSNTSVTGLDFVRAPSNPFDDHIVVARHSNNGQDIVLVDPVTGAVQNLLARQNGDRPTDVVADPYGDLVIGYSTNEIRFVEVVGGVGVGGNTNPPAPVLCDAVGFDFESPAPVFGTGGVGTNAVTNFNLFDTQATDGTTVSATGFVDVTGASVAGLGLEVTNNLGKETGLTGVVSTATTVSPFDEVSIYSDSYGGANVGNMSRADFGTLNGSSNIVLTFTGLNDGSLYNVTGGGRFSNDNFNTVWTSGTTTATTDSDSTTGGEFVTLSDLATDGSGNLSVTVTRATTQLLFSAVTIEEITMVDPFLLGDVNLDGTVNFLDISPFIQRLSAGQFQAEADIDQNGAVNFLDISGFIALL